jgi:hypothetical protein
VKVGLLSATSVSAALRLNCGKTVNKSGCQVLQNWNSCNMYKVMKEGVRMWFQV